MNKQRGFTLVEAMITVAILVIIATIAVNTYETQKRKGYRQEAIRALTEMSIRQERWFSKEGKYTSNIGDVYSGGTATETGRYALSITFDNAKPEEYTLVAIASGPQQQDTGCFRFTLNHFGEKLAYDNANALSGLNCWSK